MKTCAISIDLDPLTAYYQIHGLGEPPQQLAGTIIARALPRFIELFAEADVPATFFLVGRDLTQSEIAKRMAKELVGAGHELANHTFSHPYDLCRLPDAEIAREISQAHETIAEICSDAHAPVGFRSPGYFINGRVLDALSAQGYQYDTSMFPSPPYWLAKILVMGTMFLRGRRSDAVVTDPRGLSTPLLPYRPDRERPWRRGDAPLIELPVTVLPGMRLPAIGTLFAAGPRWLRERVLGAVSKLPFFNFELHGIDLADAVDDRIPTELAGRQPDLRIPYTEKRRAFLGVINQLKHEGFQFVTLKQAAARYS
ncbi:MAG: polysaccharide deacetylase family protein [Deltaproteobacteria bacterium]|nr:polysaccharide deacetylase family protein [Deltaproteobacteria bacterium]